MSQYSLNMDDFESCGLPSVCTTGGGPDVRQTYLNMVLKRCFGGTPRLRPLINISCGTSESATQHSASVTTTSQ